MKNLLAVAVIGVSLIGCAGTGPGMSENDAGAKLMHSGEFSRAETHLVRALEADSKNPYALSNLGYVYEMSGRYSQSREMYQRVVDLRTNEKKPNVDLGAETESGNADDKESFHDLAVKHLAGLKDRTDRTDLAFKQ